MTTPHKRRGRSKTGLGLAFAFLLGGLIGCDSLLEVDLPDSVTDVVLEDPATAQTQVNSAMGLFECAWSEFTYADGGYSEGFIGIAGVGGSYARYNERPQNGECDTSQASRNWYQPMQTARSMGEDVFDAMNTVWTDDDVDNRQQLMATVAIYIAAVYGHFGEILCEVAIDAGPLVTPDASLVIAEQWIDTALGIIGTIGDFAVFNSISTSASTMAYGIRAHARFAQGPSKWADAQSDAERIPQGFTAFVTREAGEFRRNKPYSHHIPAYGWLQGAVDWWPAGTNPVTGQVWPQPIPFTGYLDLGIMTATGRAISAPPQYPVLLTDAGAEMDTRVTHLVKNIQGGLDGPTPLKYTAESDDLPFISWEDMFLMRAEIELSQGDGTTAISLVNNIRAAEGLPLVTYLTGASPATDIEDMILEEQRRQLFLEGRFWSTKIRHLDKLWFPRDVGINPGSYSMNGGIRNAMPTDEYELNPNFTPDDEGTLCGVSQRPIIQ